MSNSDSSFEVISSENTNNLSSLLSSSQVIEEGSSSSDYVVINDEKQSEESKAKSSSIIENVSDLSLKSSSNLKKDSEFLSYHYYSKTVQDTGDLPSMSPSTTTEAMNILAKDQKRIQDAEAKITALEAQVDAYNKIEPAKQVENHEELKKLANKIAQESKELANLCISLSMYPKAQKLLETSQRFYKILNHEAELANVLDTSGFLSYKRAQYDSSMEFYKQAAEIKLRLYGPDHSGLALTTYEIAKIHFSKANFKEAESKISEAIAILEKHPEENKMWISLINFMHSNMLVQNGEISRAEAILYESLGRLLSVFTEEHHLVKQCLIHLANIDIKKKNFDKARERLEKVYQLECKKANKSPLNISNLKKKIGVIDSKQGKYHRALSNFKVALQIRKELYGQTHPEVASALLQIGDTYMRLKEYTKATTQINNALKIYEEYFGTVHPTIANCYHSLGNIFLSQNLYDEAKGYYEKCLEIDKQFYPPDHPELTESYKGLADIHKKLGEKNLAIEKYQIVLKLKKKILGENHKDVIKIKKTIEELSSSP